MEGFFPDKFLGDIFWDELLPPADQSGFVQHTEESRIGFGQESSHLGSNSQIMNDEPLRPSNQSAFVGYREVPISGLAQIKASSKNGSDPLNMSKRMFSFLRKSCPVDRTKVAEYERERCFRHMVNERMRRQRQRQCCLALHSMLPHGTKIDNNSVIQMAAKEIQRLQGCRDELQRKNVVLEDKLIPKERSEVRRGKVQFRVTNPASGIESMVETLKCLKELGVNSISMQSNFSPQEQTAVLEIESKIADDEVERAVQRRLDEVGWMHHPHVLESSARRRV